MQEGPGVTNKHAKRSQLTTIYDSAGRSGECGKTTYSHLKVDTFFRNLVTDWASVKTLKMKEVHWVCNREGWLTDTHHAMACYLFATKGTGGANEFIFSDLHVPHACAYSLRLGAHVRVYYPFAHPPIGHKG